MKLVENAFDFVAARLEQAVGKEEAITGSGLVEAEGVLWIPLGPAEYVIDDTVVHLLFGIGPVSG